MTDELVASSVIDGQVVEPKVPTEREEWIAGVRALADFYEAHPDLPLSVSSIDLHLFPKLDEMQKYVRIFGKAKKNALGDSYFCLDREFFRNRFNTRVCISATWEREQVCEKVVTGRKKVMQTVQTKPPETTQVEVEVETFEWKCPQIAAPPKEFIEGGDVDGQ